MANDEERHDGVTNNTDYEVEYAEGTWNGKDIRFKRVWSGYRFSDEEVKKLLDGEDIELHDVIGKSGKPFSCKGHLAENTFNDIEYVGFTNTGFLNDGSSNNEYCSGTWNGRDIKFKRVWSGHKFSDEECQKLLNGEEISFEAKSKEGPNYTAKGKLAEQEFKGNKFVGFKRDFGNK